MNNILKTINKIEKIENVIKSKEKTLKTLEEIKNHKNQSLIDDIIEIRTTIFFFGTIISFFLFENNIIFLFFLILLVCSDLNKILEFNKIKETVEKIKKILFCGNKDIKTLMKEKKEEIKKEKNELNFLLNEMLKENTKKKIILTNKNSKQEEIYKKYILPEIVKGVKTQKTAEELIILNKLEKKDIEII